MNNRDRSDAQTPEDVRDLRNRTEPHLFRGMAIAKVLQALTWQYEVQWNTSEKFTLWDLAPPDLRIVCEIMADEREQAHKVLSKLAPKLLSGCRNTCPDMAHRPCPNQCPNVSERTAIMKSQSALAQSPQELTRDPLLKLSEVGEELRLTEKAVRHLIDGGQLQAYRMAGRRLRVKRSDLDRFLATQLQPT